MCTRRQLYSSALAPSLEFTNAEHGMLWVWRSVSSRLGRAVYFSYRSLSLPLLMVCGSLFSLLIVSFPCSVPLSLSLFQLLIPIVHAPTSLRLTHRNCPLGARLFIHTCVHIYIPASSDFPSTISVAVAFFLCHACIMSCNLHTHITTLPSSVWRPPSLILIFIFIIIFIV